MSSHVKIIAQCRGRCSSSVGEVMSYFIAVSKTPSPIASTAVAMRIHDTALFCLMYNLHVYVCVYNIIFMGHV